MVEKKLKMPVPEEWRKIVTKMPESELIIAMAGKGFLFVPPESWTEELKKSIEGPRTLFKDGFYLFLNPKSTLSLFSYDGMVHEALRL